LTWKERNDRALELLNPIFASRVRRFLEHMEAEGIPILITQGLRTWAEQDALFAKGRTTPGPKVTNAKGGYSQHCFGLAVDLCPDDPNIDGLQLDWDDKHPVWKKMLTEAPFFGLAEGAKWRTFPDNPHFYASELPATTETLRSEYAKGNIAGVWAWFESQIPTEVRNA
jgi:peptidoglycan LD-endopeptidase CwlK